MCDWNKQKMRLGVVENADGGILVDQEASVSEVDRQNGSNYPGIVIIDGVCYNVSTILKGQNYPIIIIHLP